MRMLPSTHSAMPARAWPGAARALLCLFASACVAPDAGAVFTSAYVSGSYSMTVQVGSAAVIDQVDFNVTGNNAGLTPAPVTGTNTSTGASGVTIRVTPNRPLTAFESHPVTVTVDSSIALSCTTPANCGSTAIPFSTISWTSTDATSPNQGDIQSGTFSGSATQQIARYEAATGFLDAATRFMSNTRNFQYANSTVYPAGQYRGTVRFTATMV
ncbi:MAG TPA: hypothetical protein VLJ86_03800 [Ramlibacter sp.]|nr:hypothetical protein [Ramlibacter sp.]